MPALALAASTCAASPTGISATDATGAAGRGKRTRLSLPSTWGLRTALLQRRHVRAHRPRSSCTGAISACVDALGVTSPWSVASGGLPPSSRREDGPAALASCEQQFVSLSCGPRTRPARQRSTRFSLVLYRHQQRRHTLSTMALAGRVAHMTARSPEAPQASGSAACYPRRRPHCFQLCLHCPDMKPPRRCCASGWAGIAFFSAPPPAPPPAACAAAQRWLSWRRG